MAYAIILPRGTAAVRGRKRTLSTENKTTRLGRVVFVYPQGVACMCRLRPLFNPPNLWDNSSLCYKHHCPARVDGLIQYQMYQFCQDPEETSSPKRYLKWATDLWGKKPLNAISAEEISVKYYEIVAQGKVTTAIPLTQDIIKMLRELQELGAFGDYVVPGRDGKSARFDLNKPWQKLQIETGLTDVHIHDLRRSFGLAIARKAGLHIASRLLRHSNVSITSKVYAPLGLDELRDALEERDKVIPFRPRASGERGHE